MLKKMIVSALAALLLTSVAMAEDLTPAQRELRAATEAADSVAIQAALEHVWAEKHGGTPPAAKPPAAASPVLEDRPASAAPTPAKPVVITSEPNKKPGWTPGKVADLEMPTGSRGLSRFFYTVAPDAGYATKENTLKAARGIFYDKGEADETTSALFDRIKGLEGRVDGLTKAAATPPVPTTQQGNMPVGPGGLGATASQNKSGNRATVAWQPPRWALPALAVVLVLLLLVLLGLRRGWSPRSWWNSRRRGGGTPLPPDSPSGPSASTP